MTRRFALRHLPLYCCFALLAACGGGGDDNAEAFDSTQQGGNERVERVDAEPDRAEAASGRRFIRPICMHTPSAPCDPQPLSTH